MVTQEELDHIVGQVVASCDPDRIIVFGSHAKGTPTAESDLDLLVVKDSSLPRHVRDLATRRLFYDSPTPVELVFVTNAEIEEQLAVRHSFVACAVRSGTVVYERRGPRACP